jgi:hypothetical protein
MRGRRLKAMREPTLAPCWRLASLSAALISRSVALGIWQAMIDAALGEGETS